MLSLVFFLKPGEDARGMVIVEELVAEFQIQPAAELRDAADASVCSSMYLSLSKPTLCGMESPQGGAKAGGNGRHVAVPPHELIDNTATSGGFMGCPWGK